MADKSKIEWTDATWPVVTGCTKVSAGCKNCYAEREWARLSANPKTCYYKRKFADVMWHPEKLDMPMHWKKPKKIFVASMGDLFHQDVPFTFVDQVFAVMALCHRHTFQILTKRPERMLQYIIHHFTRSKCARAASVFSGRTDSEGGGDLRVSNGTFPFPNVWLGVSVENQATADQRIPLLLQTPAAVRFVSAEPLLGPIDLTGLWYEDCAECRDGCSHCFETNEPFCNRCGSSGQSFDIGIDWVIVGGETGPRARPPHPDWARSIRDQCADAGVAFNFKQWGEFYTVVINTSTGKEVFRQFDTYERWVNKARTWVHGGICLDRNGREMKTGADFMRARDNGDFPVTIMHRIGKKDAGRLLDSVLHDEYPEARA